jgi:hypothetical protein
MFRTALAVLTLVVLSACGTANAPYASDAAIQAARFSASEPPSITLFTVVNNKSGSGAHSALLINGAERVLFDPAGSFTLATLPERNDIHYGMNDKMVLFYIDYHARQSYDVVEQKIFVSQAIADTIKARANQRGPVAKSYCANSISEILSGVPGFESIQQTWFPNALSEEFANLPGVSTRKITDDDADTNHGILLLDPDEAAPTVTIN